MSALTLKGISIPWGQLHKGSYLYGTDIVYLPDNRVSYRQDYLPVGTIIHSWHSRSNFQADRDIPYLPLLIKNRVYHISLSLETMDQNPPYLRLRFFNRREEILEYKIIKEGSGTFVFPAQAFSYQVELINAGCHHFIFDSIFLIEAKDHRGLDVQPYYHQVIERQSDGLDQSKPLTLMFLEHDSGSADFQVSDSVLDYIDPALIFGTISLNSSAYLSDDFLDYCQKEIEKMKDRGKEKALRFLGYGERSNRAAVFLAYIMGEKDVLISQPVSFEGLQVTENPSMKKGYTRLQSFLSDKDFLYQLADLPYYSQLGDQSHDFIAALADPSTSLSELVKDNH
ncbi:accessory Sec system protein Asp3 [Streptococcus catagoni]|uniref:accessory Sec system protein Asp3 n=1 Tax=Streptococcus catagoni TaxID=2654874 RepID=UPI00140DEF12|nr:accessory Sec system protein Asp3 [Streptococcus catagoni]